MSEYSNYLAYASALCGTLFYLLIVVSILRKRTKPSKTTWLIWWVNDLLIFCSSFAGGARHTAYLPGVYVLMGALAFVVSVRSDSQRFSFFDRICLGGAMCGWFLWVLSSAPLLGLLCGIAVNTIGAFPTWRTVWQAKRPQELFPWIVVACGGLCSILSAEENSLVVLLFPINSFVVSVLTLAVQFAARLRFKKPATPRLS